MLLATTKIRYCIQPFGLEELNHSEHLKFSQRTVSFVQKLMIDTTNGVCGGNVKTTLSNWNQKKVEVIFSVRKCYCLVTKSC